MPTLPQLFGIDNLKKIVKFACDFTKQAATSGADGWQWTDAISFFDEAMAIPGVIKSLPAVKQEINELSEEEREELYQYLVVEFDIPNNEVEDYIEDSIQWTLFTLSLISRFKGLKKPV